LGAEVPVGAAVLALAALLVGFPLPPRELRESSEALAHAKACDPYCPVPKPAPGELTVGERAGPFTAAVWLRRDGGGIIGTLRVIDAKRRPAAVNAGVRGASTQRACGTGCWRFRLPAQPAQLRVTVSTGGRRHPVLLPARWRPGGDEQAGRILDAAQRRMRALRTLRQVEVVSSSAAPDRSARTTFRFQAPDRMAYTTATTRSVVIGSRIWIRADPTLGWQPLGGVEPFRVRDAFRWTVFTATARLLAVRREGRRRVAELALLDYGYPIWYRLTVDLRGRHVVRARLLTPDNRIEDRYLGFDAPVRIRPPTRQ
jgi:hypothetical protein